MIKPVNPPTTGLVTCSIVGVSDYEDSKLTDSNIGYKMLQKAGWKEGEGLGSNEDGIKNPINQLVGGRE